MLHGGLLSWGAGTALPWGWLKAKLLSWGTDIDMGAAAGRAAQLEERK